MNSEGQFSANEWLRYTRHAQLPKFGAEGQSKLKKAHVLMVGAGGLGSPVGLYLAAAGIGTLTIVDHDRIELSNLQRQIVFSESQVGEKKAEATAQRLNALNSDITINAVCEAFNQSNAEALIGAADIVLDCTDNFSTRYLINDTCKGLKKPWIFASIHQFSGQCALFTPETPCFRCLFPQFPEGVADCNSAGVLGVLPGLLGCLQASEAIKFLAGIESPLKGHLQLVDALNLQFQRIKLVEEPDCPVCSGKAEDLSGFYTEASCEISENPHAVPADQLRELIEQDSTLLVDVRSIEERRAFNLGGEHIPMSELEASFGSASEPKTHPLLAANKDKRIALYCQSGARSERAALLLSEAGFKVASLQGGISLLLKDKSKT